jgi:hypothetical protein
MVKATRVIYLIAVWLFLVGVLLQVFLAGMVVVASKLDWESHIGLGHMLALPLLIMLISMYIARLPVEIKKYTWILFAVYIIQADVVIFLRAQAPVVAALHPVLALVDFYLAATLAWRTWHFIRQDSAQNRVVAESKDSTLMR